MAEFRSRIGSNDWVEVYFRRLDESGHHRGRLRLNVKGLKCSKEVTVSSRELERYAKGVRRCKEALRGSFSLKSPNGFKLVGKMTPTGHVRLEVVIEVEEHRQRDESGWGGHIYLSCPAHALPDH